MLIIIISCRKKYSKKLTDFPQIKHQRGILPQSGHRPQIISFLGPRILIFIQFSSTEQNIFQQFGIQNSNLKSQSVSVLFFYVISIGKSHLSCRHFNCALLSPCLAKQRSFNCALPHFCSNGEINIIFHQPVPKESCILWPVML